jgi:hypothetical protein
MRQVEVCKVSKIFGTIIVIASIPALFFIPLSSKDIPLSYVFRNINLWIYFNPARDSDKINYMEIHYPKDFTTNVTIPNLSDKSFTIDIPDTILALKFKDKDTIELPILIKSKYFSTGESKEDQSVYTLRIIGGVNPYQIDPKKHLSDKFNEKINF